MKTGIYVIIAVKNQENTIEGILQSIIFRIMYGKDDVIKKVILTDLDSKDNSFKTLKEFKKENKYINVLKWKDCKEIIDTIDDI